MQIAKYNNSLSKYIADFLFKYLFWLKLANTQLLVKARGRQNLYLKQLVEDKKTKGKNKKSNLFTNSFSLANFSICLPPMLSTLNKIRFSFVFQNFLV